MDPEVPEQDGADDVVVTKPSTVTSRGTSLRQIFATTNSHSAPDDGVEGDTIDGGNGNTEDVAEDNAIRSDAYETQDDEDEVDKAIEYVAVDTIDKAAKDAVGDDENTEAHAENNTDDDSANDTDPEIVEQEDTVEADGSESLREEQSAFLVYGTKHGGKSTHALRVGQARKSLTSEGTKKKTHADASGAKNKTTEPPHRVAAYLDERKRFFEWCLQGLMDREMHDQKRCLPPKTQAQLETVWRHELEKMWSDHSVWMKSYPKTRLLV